MSIAERRSFDIEETKIAVYQRDLGVCQALRADGSLCGNPGNQCAHKLPQDKLHLARYGKAIIHHKANMVLTCSLRCNGTVEIDYRTRPIAAEAQAERIRAIIVEEIEWSR